MQQLTSITNSPNQQMTLVLENNETVDFHLYYLPRQQSWFYDFTYNNLTVNGSRVTLTPNALRQYKRLIPFGIAFDTQGFVEPFSINDFASGRIGFYILNSDEVEQIEKEVYNV